MPELPDHTSRNVCGLCLRGWGSVLVTPPAGYFSVQTKRGGKFHGKGRAGKTACGKPIPALDKKGSSA